MKLLFLVAATAWAQVEAPTIGVMLDAAGAYRAVYGVAGTFTLGPPVEPVQGPLTNTISFDEAGLIVRYPDASEVRFALPGVTLLRSMSEEWLQAITPHGSFALRITRGREALFALPAPRPEVRRR